MTNPNHALCEVEILRDYHTFAYVPFLMIPVIRAAKFLWGERVPSVHSSQQILLDNISTSPSPVPHES